MASLGATVVEPQPEDSPVSDDKVERGKTPADILVVYRDIDRSTGACGWLLIPFVMSGTLFPCFADATSKAQVTVTDIKDGRTTTWPLEVRIRRYAGLGALPLLAMDSLKALPRRQFHKQLAHNFAQFVRNKTYTAAVLRDGAP